MTELPFFPEGGGQYADTGRLDDAKVTDVQEKAGIIYHKTNQSLEIGKQYRARLTGRTVFQDAAAFRRTYCIRDCTCGIWL